MAIVMLGTPTLTIIQDLQTVINNLGIQTVSYARHTDWHSHLRHAECHIYNRHTDYQTATVI